MIDRCRGLEPERAVQPGRAGGAVAVDPDRRVRQSGACEGVQRRRDQRRCHPAPTPLAQRAQRRDPPVAAPDQGIVLRISRVQTVGDDPVVGVDAHERAVEERPVTADHRRPVRRRRRRRPPVVGERRVLLDTDLLAPVDRPGHDPEPGDRAGRRLRRQVGQRSQQLLEVAHGHEPVTGDESVIGLAVVVRIDPDRARQVVVRSEELLAGAIDRPRHQRAAHAAPTPGRVHVAEDVAPLLALVAREVVRERVPDHRALRVDRDPCVGREHHRLVVEVLLDLLQRGRQRHAVELVRRGDQVAHRRAIEGGRGAQRVAVPGIVHGAER